MGRISAHSWRFRAFAFAGAVLLFSAAAHVPAQAQGAGAGFETAPGSQPVITSNGMPVVNTAPATPMSGVAAQPDYGGFAGAPPGMYVAPLGYDAPMQTAPAAAAPGGVGLTPTPGYSIQAQPTAGPYANAPQPSPYGAPQPYVPPPYAYGAPTPDYTPQAYAQPGYGAPQPYAPPAYPMPYAPAPYAAQPPAPYAAAPQPMPPRQPMAPAQPANNPGAVLPYSSGVTAYGAPLPRNVAMPQAQGGAAVEGGYTLGPGDKVRVTIYNEPDLSGEYQLDGNGNIRLPLVGMMRAVGYTAGGLEAWIRATLSPNYLRDPRINVEITGYRPIYVVGAVQKPGQYSYINDMTLLNAVALAGGFTSQSKESVVYVRHEGQAAEVAVPTNVPLLIRPGDTVRVDTTMFWDAMNLFSPLSSPIGLAAAVR